MLKKLLSVILMLSILLLSSCGRNTDKTILELSDEAEHRAMDEYRELLKKEEDNLVELINWLYEKEGYYNLHLDGPYLDTDKGEDYGLNSENTKRFLKILKKYKLEAAWIIGLNEKVYFLKTETIGKIRMFHELIYRDGEDADEGSTKLADNFYYRCEYKIIGKN